MSFFTPTNQYMVVDRNIQLLVKKTLRSQKTLEGSLSIRNENGETISISSRVAELDQLMPQYLGVSKAILESVIFCHQDESLWPMSTPSLLKKRFDEIFEAHKYTKAIDNLKMIRKRKMDDLGKQKLVEQHAKDDKERGARTERKSQEDLRRDRGASEKSMTIWATKLKSPSTALERPGTFLPSLRRSLGSSMESRSERKRLNRA